jgi:uncharacterized protein (TIGR00296 family)
MKSDLDSAKASKSLFGETDGVLLISSAREMIEKYLDTKALILPSSISHDARFSTKLGCFVTLKNDDEEKSLRGCIGIPEPIYHLRKALADASISAATRDPRFPAVKRSEINNLLLEVSILTKPVLLTTSNLAELPKLVQVGRDGLIMKWSYGSGLLLPQVATEYGWGAEDFLCNLSIKAGAPPDQWLLPGTQIFAFRAHVYQEESPRGKVTMSGE